MIVFFRKRGQTSAPEAATEQAPVPAEPEAAPARPAEAPNEEYLVISRGFDRQHYWQSYADVAASGMDPVQHYLEFGWKEGRNPSPGFNTVHYLARNADVEASGVNPFYHYLKYGQAEGRLPLPNALTAAERRQVDEFFDADWYLKGFPPDQRPADPVEHYFQTGWRDGRDPSPLFSTRVYLAQNPDIAAAGMNPFLHWVQQGRFERRVFGSGLVGTDRLYAAQAAATARGPQFEDWDDKIGEGRKALAKVLAYYLPQFHPIAENDAFWGKGFTEWRNVARGMPRFEGHIQPRVPGDLGYYDLEFGETYRRQIEMARKAGIHGFCFYYYWFNRKRVLDKPIERMLDDPSLNFPFVLMWANENWTRTWDGLESDVLLKQDYAVEDDEALIDDLARHMKDPRYMRVDGRPLFFIYRPGAVPDAKARFETWRGIFRKRHKIDPLILHAQCFESHDPRPLGLDGAIEFPPHKIGAHVTNRRAEKKLLDPGFSGMIYSYDQAVDIAAREPVPEFPLIRCAFPSWDNESRRPGRGHVYADSTPAAFERWMRSNIAFARRHRLHKEAIVAVNAWNEWAEGSYLEPDVHFGGAYLNALARAVFGVSPTQAKERSKIVILGHDAHRHGAQQLALMIGQLLTRRFGVDVAFVLLNGGAMIKDYAQVGQVEVVDGPATVLSERLAALRKAGYSACITNTTVTGKAVPVLKAQGFTVISLVHELGTLIRGYGLTDAARAIAAESDRVIFPAEVVRDSFLAVTGPAANTVEVFPQGLYRRELLATPLPGPADRSAARARLGLPETGTVVINVGFGDLRKGVDRFAAVALEMCGADPQVTFAWIGASEMGTTSWAFADVERLGLTDRIRRTGHVEEMADWYAAADVLFLTSREDPFPSVVMEAMAAGLPVVGYAGCGGCDGLIAEHGALVDPLKAGAAAEAIRRFAGLPATQRKRQAAARRKVIETQYSFPDYGFGLLQRLDPKLPKVSAILPNYNYEAHLPMRLDSIFDQTSPLQEVIVLDDASPDRSVEVIRAVAQARGRDIRLEVNAKNTGSPFAQWKKGLGLASGDFVWIAEADDTADPRLVSTLVSRMQEEGADFGFCDSWQIDAGDNRIGESYQGYMTEFPAGTFARSFAMDGQEFLRRYLAVKNVILNVSSVVFRREALARALEAVGKELMDYSVAGDWRLYAELCLGGGRMVYVAEALNGHRRHATSVTHALKVEKHLSEIEGVQKLIASRVNLDAGTRKKQDEHLEACRLHLLALTQRKAEE